MSRAALAGGRAAHWSRRYPPLTVVVIALALAIFVLPSALNLPQANPGQTLEYAPVPGNNPGLAQGNLAALGLGSGSSGPGGLLAPPPAPGLLNQAIVPSDKQCVGNPPRQTEDPLSPPCVAYFKGDNGGSTYAGVSGTDIKLLFYIQGGVTVVTGSASSTTPTNQLVDLDAPPQPNEYTGLQDLRNWLRYFNARYQTYGRTVHGYVYFSSGGGTAYTTPSQRHADAADNLRSVHPFAAIEDVTVTIDNGNASVYTDDMASAGVLNFGETPVTPQSVYARYPGLIWSFRPSLEEVAANYSAFICQKVAPYPASFSGNPGENGNPRVYGFLSTSDQSHPELMQLASLVKQQIQGCGVQIRVSHQYPQVTCGVGSSDGQMELTNMADFQRQHVTTVIWPGGCETKQSNDAQSLNYYPEWIMADAGGDTHPFGASQQGQQAWSHAWIVTPVTYQNTDGQPVEPPCRDAYASVSPQASASELQLACTYYDDLRQFFIAVQVAGPKLTPANINAGFHAIPPHPSTGPTEPACFYDPGDYTCVKDDIAEWWDSSPAAASASGDGSSGCWRMGDHGLRYLRGRWTKGDVWTLHQNDDPCNLDSNLG